tara:strand:- start:4107 stop:4961 length:855 start_codon:yes stop_codon:yes gene_type:complete
MLSPMLSVQAQLEGMIDLHVHAAPDSDLRSVDAYEVARMARRNGMQALLFKNHNTHTASLAYLVSQVVPEIGVYGGITLNKAVGGINPIAVRLMAETTNAHGRVVWMPTRDSEHAVRNSGGSSYVSISNDGELLPEVLEVLDVIADFDLSLATGHSSPAESLLLIQEARARGIEKIIVTHPFSPSVSMSPETQRAAAEMGALLEYPISLSLGDDERFAKFVEQLRLVNTINVVLSTDLGQVGRPVPSDGLALSIRRLIDAGITNSEINVMTKRNPAQFLGLQSR